LEIMPYLHPLAPLLALVRTPVHPPPYKSTPAKICYQLHGCMTQGIYINIYPTGGDIPLYTVYSFVSLLIMFTHHTTIILFSGTLFYIPITYRVNLVCMEKMDIM
jgi:hypothetical protein